MQMVHLGSQFILVLAHNHNGRWVVSVSCVCIFLFLLTNQMACQLRLYIIVLANTMPEPIYCFCLTINCKRFINSNFKSVVPVYFCSLKQPKWSVRCAHIFLFLLTHCQNLYIVLGNTKLWQKLRLYIFVLNKYPNVLLVALVFFFLDHTFPELIYCFCVTLNCYNSYACFFVLSKYPNCLLVAFVYFCSC